MTGNISNLFGGPFVPPSDYVEPVETQLANAMRSALRMLEYDKMMAAHREMYGFSPNEAVARALMVVADRLAERDLEVPPPTLNIGVQHASDCAVHNAPAYEAGPCTCGALSGLAQAATVTEREAALDQLQAEGQNVEKGFAISKEEAEREAIMHGIAPGEWDQSPLRVAAEMKRLLLAMADQGTSIDSGGGDGVADLWLTVGGVEFYVQIRKSNLQKQREGQT